MRRFAVIGLTFLLAADAAAQQQQELARRRLAEAALPAGARQRLLRLADAPGAVYLDGPSVIAAGATVPGPVVVLDGPLEVAGRIEGGLLVIGGHVRIEPSGVVVGDLTVVRGSLERADEAVVRGDVAVYDDEGRRVVPRRGERSPGGFRVLRRRLGAEGAEAAIVVGAAGAYNRVEGLPLRLGPELESGGAWPFHLSALAMVRTAVDRPLGPNGFGYLFRGDGTVLSRPLLRLAATVGSAIEPLDRWRLHDREASLAAFLLRRDHRDAFERSGWAIEASLAPEDRPLRARVEYRRDDHRTAVPADPWTLFRRDEPWTALPLVAEGRLQSIRAGIALDTRADAGAPSSGWYVAADLERGLGGSLVVPSVVEPAGESAPAQVRVGARAADARFTAGWLDMRRHAAVGSAGSITVRLVLAGSLAGGELPPQAQHALGGPGTLPGQPLNAIDCGARRAAYVRTGGDPGTRYHLDYGCDRVALFQLELRRDLSMRTGYDHEGPGDPPWGWRIDFTPTAVAFFDAGRGWIGGRPSQRGREDSPALYDAGLGLLLGGLGLYAAVPLDGDGGPRLRIRLGRRI